MFFFAYCSYLERLAKRHHARQFVLSCCGPEPGFNCENSFRPVVTENGICFSFDPTYLNDSLIDNSYTNTFKKIFYPETEGQDWKTGLKGDKFSMQITLDSHNSRVH